MDRNVQRDPRITWIFAIAAGLVIIGAVAPLALTSGGPNRLNVVAIPYVIAGVALAGTAYLAHQGRLVAASLYFVAGLAIVYGILGMLAVPLRLAVLGTCPAGQPACPSGFEPALTGGETSALDTATLCGLLAIFIAFYGLALVYRRRRPATTKPATASPASPPTTHADTVTANVEPLPDPLAGEELKELPAPEEPKELPPPA